MSGVKWRKVRGKDEWRTPGGFVITIDPFLGYQSRGPDDRMIVVMGASLDDAKRLTKASG